MDRDYADLVAKLLAKASDPATPLDESIALTERAKEIREKHNIPENSGPVYTVHYFPSKEEDLDLKEFFDLLDRLEPNGFFRFPDDLEDIIENGYRENGYNDQNKEGDWW